MRLPPLLLSLMVLTACTPAQMDQFAQDLTQFEHETREPVQARVECQTDTGDSTGFLQVGVNHCVLVVKAPRWDGTLTLTTKMNYREIKKSLLWVTDELREETTTVALQTKDHRGQVVEGHWFFPFDVHVNRAPTGTLLDDYWNSFQEAIQVTEDFTSEPYVNVSIKAVSWLASGATAYATAGTVVIPPKALERAVKVGMGTGAFVDSVSRKLGRHLIPYHLEFKAVFCSSLVKRCTQDSKTWISLSR